MKCIYWNVKGIETIERISDILVDHSPEVFFLSEIDSNVMAKSINLLSKVGYEVFENPGCERITILKKMVFDVQLSLQARYYSTIKVVEGALYIISVHLPSQMYQHLDALKGYIRDLETK